jgi:hypothetical protein
MRHFGGIVLETFKRTHVACVDLLTLHFKGNPAQVMGPTFSGPMVRERSMNRDDE